jgi:signal transduction histidine kinase
MASPASITTGLRAAARDRLAPSAVLLFQVGWLALQLGAVGLALAGTPALHNLYQATCLDVVCDKLPQPTADSVAVLDRLGIPRAVYAGVMTTVEWGWLSLWAGLGAVIVWKRPRDPVGMALAYTGVAVAVGTFTAALSWAGSRFVAIDVVANVVTAVTLPLLIGLFPDGRWVPRWARWVGLVAILFEVAREITVTPSTGQFYPLDIPVYELMMVVLLGAQVYRYRRVSTAIQRLQAKWVLFGISIIVLTQVIASAMYVTGTLGRYQFGLLPIAYGGEWLTVLAIGFAVLRYRLFDIDVIINRALVYGGLTAIVAVIYALIVGGVGALLRAQGGLALSFLATGVIAVLFQPLRAWLQRGVNRLLYGERDEPYAVVARLGRRLESSLAPDAVLPTIVETVAAALKLPYAAIALREEGGMTVAVERGTPPSLARLNVPLVYQGETVGELRLAPRPGEQKLSSADRRLVDDLARQAGIAVRATQLTRDLQRARERLVTAREEERRRLRRDLHDGLGPALASQALTVDTAQLLLERDPQGAAALLRSVKDQSQAAVAEIRRVAYALRPPALDDLGLVGALREAASRYAGTELGVAVEAPEALPSLPAAVEVAAFRVAQEAVANVTRHAGAANCVVTLVLADDALTVTIADDGVGIAPGRRAGVGLTSMRERAEELGGTCVIEPNRGGGTRVIARLPL